MKPVTLRQTISRKDIFEYTLFIYLRSTGGRIITGLVLLSLGLSVVNLWMAANRGGLHWTDWVFTVLIGIVVPGFIAFLLYNTANRFHKGNRYYFTDMELLFSEKGIIFRLGDKEQAMDWSAIARAFETKQYFYIMMDKRMGHVVKKAAMKSTEDEDRLRALLQEKQKLR